MSDFLKIVVVGCGGISNRWFRAVKEIEGVTVAGVVDLLEAAAHKKKQEYELSEARIGTDVEAMLREVAPDVIFDCTIPDARATVVRAALRHGCHVLSEKPMAATLAEARDLVGEAKKAGRLFAVMQNRRYQPPIRALESFLKSGELGGLTTLNCDFYIGAHFGGFRDRMPHVLLLDMAIHSFDQARLISGADPVAVYCQEWNPRDSWYERDASAVAIFEMTGGIVYTYRGSWCAEGINTSWECEWRAIGTKGTVTWNGGDRFHAQKVAGAEGFNRPLVEVPVSVPTSSAPSEHAGCIHDFIDCVRTERVPETVCTENIKSLAMVFAAIESAERHVRVPIQT